MAPKIVIKKQIQSIKLSGIQIYGKKFIFIFKDFNLKSYRINSDEMAGMAEIRYTLQISNPKFNIYRISIPTSILFCTMFKCPILNFPYNL